jgi:phage shock protein PspC (stress-responsive transcriptional regulator)
MNASDTDQETSDPIDDSHPQADSQPQTDSRPSYQSQYSYRADDEPLYRPLQGRMLAGVAAGIAQYLGVDVTVVRIVLAALTFVGGAGVPVYVAGWLLIPDEGASQSIASQLISSVQGRTN